METEFFNLKRSWLILGTLILITVVAVLIPTKILFHANGVISPVLAYFLGINLILFVVGMFALAFYIIRQWSICIDYTYKMREKETEKNQKDKTQEFLNEDANSRREFERERNQINDMFRLIELAKEKPEEITDTTKTKEKGEVPKLIANDKTTRKNEGVNTEKLDKLIAHYQSIISNQ